MGKVVSGAMGGLHPRMSGRLDKPRTEVRKDWRRHPRGRSIDEIIQRSLKWFARQ